MGRQVAELNEHTRADAPHRVTIGSNPVPHPALLRGLAWAALVVACLALGAFLELPEAVETPGTDTGMYATYGQLLLRGARPYIDFWDLHPPLVFAYWAAVEALTGPEWLRTCFTVTGLAPQSCTGSVAHALDLLLSVVAAVFAALIARRAGGSRPAQVLTALLVVGFADQVMLSDEGSNPSKLTLVPGVVSVWAYLRSLDSTRPRAWAVAAGAAAGVAALAKQPALLTLLALVLYAAYRRDRQRLIALLVGAGVVLAGAGGVLSLRGSLDGYIREAWIYNVERSFAGYFVHPVKQPGITLDRVLKEAAGVLAVLAVLGGAMLAVKPLYRHQRLLVWWATLNVIAVTAFREFVYVVPSMAVIAAVGLARTWDWTDRRASTWTWLLRAVLIVSMLVAIRSSTTFQQVQIARARGERGAGGGVSQPEELGRILIRDVPRGALFVYGNAAELYPISGRTPATPYLNAEAIRSSAPHAERTRAALVAELEDVVPRVIVLAPHDDDAELDLGSFPSMRWFLQACYRRRPINRSFDRNWTVLVTTGECERRTRS